VKKWEFTNLIETNVCTSSPEAWMDKPEAAKCPKGWLLIIDAENEIIGMAPREIAKMIETLFNQIEKTNKWEDPA
jgi:hypothetical protein